MGKKQPPRRQPQLQSARRERFIAEYLIDLNATQAAKRAGYSARTAYAQGQRLLKDAQVGRAISEAKQVRARQTAITSERVVNELALLAFSDVTHYKVDDNGRVTLVEGAPEGAERAIKGIKRRTHYDEDGNATVEVEIKLWDKPGPLKLAGRHVGVKGFYDRLEVSDPDGKPLIPSRDDAISALRAFIGEKTSAPDEAPPPSPAQPEG